MAENKKYYWLKLKSDFFDDDTIKYIEEQENGIKYSNFYLKLCLKSLKTNGKLIRLIGETLIPYDINSLSKLTGVDFDTVRSAMHIFESIGLVKLLDSGEIYLSQINELIGSETDKAQIMRRIRAEKKLNGNNVTQMLPDIEKEIDIEKEKEINADEDMNNICKTYVKHMENETATATENININKNIIENKKEENEKNCIKFYIENINPLISQYEFETLNNFCEELSDELMIYAMKDAIEHNAKNMKYLKTIFSRYIAQGIKTVEQAEAQQKGYNKQIKQETEEERKERIIKYLKENCEEYEEEKEKPKKINKILNEEEIKIIL